MFQDIIKRFKDNYRLQRILLTLAGWAFLFCVVEVTLNGYAYYRVTNNIIEEQEVEIKHLREMRSLKDSTYQARIDRQDKEIEALKEELAHTRR